MTHVSYDPDHLVRSRVCPEVHIVFGEDMVSARQRGG